MEASTDSMSLVIFSDKIRSGKTTGLMNWSKNRSGVAGILMPDVEGKRMFYDIASEVFFPAEASPSNDLKEDLVTIGRFSFNRKSFEKANRIIRAAFVNKAPDIIIDEIGKLELNGEGFYQSVKYILSNDLHKQNNVRILMVVRADLLSEIRSELLSGDFSVIESMNGFD